MEDLSDEDPFAFSDDDKTIQSPCYRNPVEDHLLKKVQDVMDRVDRTKNNVDGFNKLTNTILRKLHVRATHGESSGSDNDSDLYQVTGEPIEKKKCTRRHALGQQPLIVQEVWQKVIDDKWIVGIALKNVSNRILTEPCAYVLVENETEIRGTASFWEIINDSPWTRTTELRNDSEKLVVTVVLDLPNFEHHDSSNGFGVISYTCNEKILQTAIPKFHLNSVHAIDRTLAPRYTVDPENSILAIKSIAHEKVFTISLEKPERGAEFLSILEDKGFHEILTDVHISKNSEAFRHCIIEILPFTVFPSPESTVRISARSSSQLNIIILMLRNEFPYLISAESENKAMEAAMALQHELELELAGNDPGALHMARIRTDLLIP